METLYDTRDREAMTVGYHMEGIPLTSFRQNKGGV